MDKQQEQEMLNSELAPMPKGRPGVSKVEKFGWTIKDEPGSFAMISKSVLQVDDTSYQRALSDARSVTMAREWSWIACGTLSVASREDGSLWVFDGQHRLAAARKRTDIKELPCMVFKVEPGLEGEADAFLSINTGRKGLSSVDRFPAQLTSNVPAALLVKRLMDAAGYELSGSSAHGKTIKCVGALVRIANDQTHLEAIWPLLVKIHDDQPFHERVVCAIDYLARASNGKILSGKHRERLEAAGKGPILDAIAKFSVAYSDSRGGAKVWAKGVAEHIINKGMQEQNRVVID